MSDAATAVQDAPADAKSRRRAREAQPDKPKKKEYPFVCVGMTVLWYDHALADTPPVPAVVMAVGDMAVDLTILHDDGPTQSKSGVRFLHQKNVPEPVREESGGWDYTEADIRLQGEFPDLREWPEERKPKGAKKADKPPA